MLKYITENTFLFGNRFEFFFISLLSILFGSLFVPFDFFEIYLFPILLLLNIISGVVLVSERKGLASVFIVVFFIELVLFGAELINHEFRFTKSIRYFMYFIYFTLITYNIIRQVWLPRCVNRNLIFGLMCGYISLGLLGFFIFSGIELISPGSYVNLISESQNVLQEANAMLYYSFVTLLTLGYGDIVPITVAAKKATILMGLTGQFYMVIITGVVVGKYINEGQI